MNKTYLVVLSGAYSRDAVKAFVNEHPSVSFWFLNLPSTLFVRTTMSAKDLSQALVGHFGQHRHFVSEVTANRAGVLPKDHWKFFTA